MNPRRKSRLSIIIFVILGISIATGLVLYALRQTIDLFYTPSEVLEVEIRKVLKFALMSMILVHQLQLNTKVFCRIFSVRDRVLLRKVC